VLKFSTQYRFSDSKMIYALYSEGFRLGGNNDPRASAGGILPAEYKPDTLENYEVGVKTRWLDQSLQVNLTAFFMEWQDIQLNRSGSTAGNPWWMRGTFNGGIVLADGGLGGLKTQKPARLRVQGGAHFLQP